MTILISVFLFSYHIISGDDGVMSLRDRTNDLTSHLLFFYFLISFHVDVCAFLCGER